jgi:hypothetical protein
VTARFPAQRGAWSLEPPMSTVIDACLFGKSSRRKRERHANTTVYAALVAVRQTCDFRTGGFAPRTQTQSSAPPTFAIGTRF